ncbi:MAG: hypothetical protein NT062_16335 [Proteobacteria bacterium]|nr:hypothetical protein [Pseudomonadota bacterium]
MKQFDAQELTWSAYERQLTAAARARAEGLDVQDPIAPDSMFQALRALATMPAELRAGVIAQATVHRQPMPVGDSVPMRNELVWIAGEAMARGLACDFATAYQAWFVFADLLLRDDDIGAIIARVHPERVETRSPRLDDVELRALDADLARQERKRVNRKQKSFGYAAA